MWGAIHTMSKSCPQPVPAAQFELISLRLHSLAPTRSQICTASPYVLSCLHPSTSEAAKTEHPRRFDHAPTTSSVAEQHRTSCSSVLGLWPLDCAPHLPRFPHTTSAVGNVGLAGAGVVVSPNGPSFWVGELAERISCSQDVDQILLFLEATASEPGVPPAWLSFGSDLLSNNSQIDVCDSESPTKDWSKPLVSPFHALFTVLVSGNSGAIA